MKQYQNLEHTADLKIRAFGKTKEDVFRNMAMGMFENIAEQNDIFKNQPVKREIKVSADDLPGLLVEFLNELITLSDINNEIYLDYGLRISGFGLEGDIKGYKIRGLKMEIKAVTYNELKLEERRGKWMAEVVFDI